MKFNFTSTGKKNKKPTNIENFSYTTIHPARDWYALLIIFIIICLAGALWSIYLFYLSKEPLDQSVMIPQVNKNSRTTTLKKIIGDFDEKETRRNEAMINSSDINDPSL